jgi:hypothetical protein
MDNLLLTETKADGRKRWLRVDELPFSRVTAYRLIADGVLQSVALGRPGSRKAMRLIDGCSLDAYLEGLMAQQKAAGKKGIFV